MTPILHQIKNPFPFLQIENFYSEDELKLIWQELEFLNYPHKLEPPENTGFSSDQNPEIIRIENEINIASNNNHSGCSMACTMRMMQRIAKNNQYQ